MIGPDFAFLEHKEGKVVRASKKHKRQLRKDAHNENRTGRRGATVDKQDLYREAFFEMLEGEQ